MKNSYRLIEFPGYHKTPLFQPSTEAPRLIQSIRRFKNSRNFRRDGIPRITLYPRLFLLLGFAVFRVRMGDA